MTEKEIAKAPEPKEDRKPRKPISRRKIAKAAAFVTLGLFVLWVILTFLAYAFNIEVEPIRSLWLFLDKYVDVGALGLVGEYVLYFVPMVVAWAAYLGIRARERAARRVAQRRKAQEEKEFDGILDGLEPAPATKASEPEEDEDIIPEKDVKRIIQNYRLTRRKMRLVVKAIGALFCLVFFYYVVTNFDGALYVAVMVLYYFALFLWLLQNQTMLMLDFFAVFAGFGFLYYAIPYRLTHKVLKVVDAGKVKELGRVKHLKGVDDMGYPFRSVVYNLWGLKRWFEWARSHPEKPWPKSRPSPHEFPFWDVYYLRGRKITVKIAKNGGPAVDAERVEQFKRCIILQSNTDGWLKRRLHPIPLYTNASLDIGWTVITAVDDGCKVHFIPRHGVESISHFELTTKPSFAVERDLSVYREYVDSSVENAASVVLRGVKADSELQKDSQRRFLLPSSRTLARRLGHQVDEKGNVKTEPEEKK